MGAETMAETMSAIRTVSFKNGIPAHNRAARSISEGLSPQDRKRGLVGLESGLSCSSSLMATLTLGDALALQCDDATGDGVEADGTAGGG